MLNTAPRFVQILQRIHEVQELINDKDAWNHPSNVKRNHGSWQQMSVNAGKS